MGRANLRLVTPSEPEGGDSGEGPLGVRVVEGLDRGKAAPFVDGVLRIGLADGNHLRLTDPEVNPRHAELSLTADGVLLRDLGTRHGTWMRDIRGRDIRVRGVFLESDRRFRVARTEIELVRLSEEVVGT